MGMPRATASDIGLFVLRLSGAMLIVHGWEHLDLATNHHSQWLQFVGAVDDIGFPQPKALAWAAVIVALGGGIAMLLGLYTRFAAAAAAVMTFVVAFMYHSNEPFDVRETPVLYFIAFTALTLTGGGKLTIDKFWMRRRRAG